MKWSVEIIISIVGMVITLLSMGVTIYCTVNTKKIRDNFLKKISTMQFIRFISDLESLYESLSHKQTIKNNNKGGQCIDIFTKIDRVVVDINKHKEKVKNIDKKELENLVSSLRVKVNKERSNPTIDFTDLRNLVYGILIIFNKHKDESTKNIVD